MSRIHDVGLDNDMTKHLRSRTVQLLLKGGLEGVHRICSRIIASLELDSCNEELALTTVYNIILMQEGSL